MIRYEMNHLTINFADDLPHCAEEVQYYHDKAVEMCPDAVSVDIKFGDSNAAQLRFHRFMPTVWISRPKLEATP